MADMTSPKMVAEGRLDNGPIIAPPRGKIALGVDVRVGVFVVNCLDKENECEPPKIVTKVMIMNAMGAFFIPK